MDKLLECRDTSSDEDYYELLGCNETSSDEQISTEFKLLAKKYHPDKASADNQLAAERIFMKLERARRVLLDKDLRSKYDHWRTGGFKAVVTFEKWLELQNRFHTSAHWVVPKEPVLSLPDTTANHSEASTSGSSAKPASLDDFRRGNASGTNLKNFRNYK